MCGIAGFVGNGTRDALESMADSLLHRGPDDRGLWHDGEVGLAHTRLSIIDLSPSGHQPMSDFDRQCTVVFNGEVYNFKELRVELSSYPFKTHSDTEVILAAYRAWGMKAFERLEGMFAIALWDSKEHALVLVRDRMGEKPLYYTRQDGTFAFASELKTLMVSGLVKKELDIFSLSCYLQFDYVPTPQSILKHVYKLEPATALVFKDGAVRKEKFWVPPRGLSSLSEADALHSLDKLLQKTVSRELVADVPVGVFLSGGIDSSAVAFYAQRISSRPVETFSIGFEEKTFDESVFARDVARHLGTIHHEQCVSARDTLDLVESLPEVLSEPVADASILPTMLLSRFARSSVTVALGGDGGDELFAGYPTFQADDVYKLYAWVPPVVSDAARSIAHLLPASHASFSFSYNLKKLLSAAQGDRVRRHMEWLGSFNTHTRDELLASQGSSQADVFAPVETALKDFTQQDAGNRLLFAYARSYLMDQVLVKVDRASMHYALEVRAPLLDRPIVDFVYALPYEMKYRRMTTKYLLKKLMSDKLPAHIVYRKKKGFGIPLARWLNGELRGLVDELLSEEALLRHGLFDPKEVQRLVLEHRDGRRDNRKELWNLMLFQLWHKRWM